MTPHQKTKGSEVKVASITKIQSVLNFLINQISIFYSCPQIYELRHIFRNLLDIFTL
jgi:hypothetical protein